MSSSNRHPPRIPEDGGDRFGPEETGWLASDGPIAVPIRCMQCLNLGLIVASLKYSTHGRCPACGTMNGLPLNHPIGERGFAPGNGY